jgi:FkbM family methyltransferase
MYFIAKTKVMRNSRSADPIARILNLTGSFRGKARFVDLLGRAATAWNRGHGTFPLPDGKTVTVDMRDRIQRLMWGGAYEPHVKRCLMVLLRPGDTFVDVGSHIEFFSLIASSLVGSKGHVYAFEANSDLFEKLKSNAAEYPWMVPSLRAVWSESGTVSFSNPEQAGETGWGKLTAVRNEGTVSPVEAISLDEWHESVGFQPIRAIKIDAEGSEPFILEGAQRIIAKTRPILIIELNDQLLAEVGRPREGIIGGIRDKGYRIFSMGTNGIDEQLDLNKALLPELLCMPSEIVEEASELLML